MLANQNELQKQIFELQQQVEFLQSKCALLEQNESEFVWMLNRNLKFEYISPASEKRLGYKSDELIGQGVDVFFDQPTLRKLQHDFKKLYKKVYFEKLSQFPGCMELEFTSKDGKKLWFEIVFKVNFQHNKIHQIHGTACDITTKRQAQVAFDRSHKALDMILDGIDTIIVVSDIETKKILYVNQYTQANYGAVQGKKCWHIFDNNQNKNCPFCKSAHLFDQNGRPLEAQVWEHKIPGTNKWFEISNKAIKWVDGRWVSLEIASEISNRKKDEKRLLQMIKQQSILSEISLVFNQYQDLSGHMNEVLRPLGQKLDVSKIFVYELQSERLVEKHIWNASGTPASARASSADISSSDFPIETLRHKKLLKIRDVLKSDLSPAFLQYAIENKMVSLLAVPYYEMGVFKGVVGFGQHEPYNWMMHETSLLKTFASIISVVYDRQNAYKKLKKSEKDLSEANAAKDKFFSIIAHDLKNPFSNLIGISELLHGNLNEWDKDKIKKFVGYLHTSAQQGYDLLKNLLEWSRSQTGRIAFQPRETQIYFLAETIIDLLNSSAQSKNIEIHNRIPPDLKLLVDENMMATVFRNLISNAIKFTKTGGIISLETRQIMSGFVDLVFSDTGIGMAAQDQERLFRIDINYTTKGTNQESGTGLGLIICKEFVERHGGKIWVESKIDEGSRFYVRIPTE